MTATTAPETTIVEEPGSHAATVSAVVNGTKQQVFRAFTEPDLMIKWWGPAELKSRVERYDARTGGGWHIVHIDPDGNEYGFQGVFHLVSPEQIILTFEFDGAPGHVSLETASFEEVDGKTKVTMHDVYQSVEDRDAMMNSGGRDHSPIAFAQLNELLQTL